jgi:signal transduction histidine kinase
VGIDLVETPVGIAFCKHAIEQNNVFMVEDATKDDRFRTNPLVTGFPDIRFYAGTPLKTTEGYNIGTLCVLDNKPGDLTPDQQDALEILGKQVVKHLELKKAFKTLQEKNKKIEVQQNELKQLLSFKDKIFAVVGHDLQSPIKGLIQVMELLNNGGLNEEEFRGVIPVLANQVKIAGDILDNIMAWAKSQRSGLNIELVPVLVNDLFAEIIGMLGVDASKKNIKITTNVGADIPVVNLNKEAITIVLRNLVKNSIKFCNPNDKIILSCSLENNTLFFSVKDTGIGFDKTIANKLFKTAEHVTTYGTAHEKGTGLGLLICKNLVELNGGRIWAEGKPNEGASFYFTIPV